MVSGAGEGEAGPSWSHERAPRAERTLAEEETHIQLGEDGWAEGEARKKDPTGKQAAGDQMALPPLSPGDQRHGLPGPAAGRGLVLGKRNHALKRVFNGQARPELGSTFCRSENLQSVTPRIMR